MTEEDKLKNSIGCGSVIMLGLIVVVLLSLVGAIFPMEILPYPREILLAIAIVGAVALVVAIAMWRGKRKDKIQEANDQADKMLREQLHTLGDKDDAAHKLAEKYKE